MAADGLTLKKNPTNAQIWGLSERELSNALGIAKCNYTFHICVQYVQYGYVRITTMQLCVLCVA